MCGFAGFGTIESSLWDERYLWSNLGRRMCSRISHRGPDDRGVHVSPMCVLAHARLAIMDPKLGVQPMTCTLNSKEVTLAYNGELYNAPELRRDLEKLGYRFETNCDTEVVLKAYVEYGLECAEKFNGIYAFAVDDNYNERIVLCRDRFGVKPLFYSKSNDRLVFASEIKALFEYPGIKPVLDKDGLCEVFGLGPAKTPGSGVFKGIDELKPGRYLIFDKDGIREKTYFKIKAEHMEDSYDQAVEKVRELLYDIAERQLVADVPVCTFLSGGLDSSVITALAAKLREGKGEKLTTYSFCFEGNDEHFKANSYQPSADEPWARLTAEYLGTEHHSLYCTSQEQYSCLKDAVIAKDLPGMADVESSLLVFCRQVKNNHKVALCGECADEVFGGYPWFGTNDFNTFPWCKDLSFRESVLRPELVEAMGLTNYVQKQYQNTLDETPIVESESYEERRAREMSYLNLRWFMQTLLDRKDRCSMYNGLEVRVPYADHRLVEYVYNCPWEYKFKDGVKKSLLRDAARGLLPDEILYRKKSPYPKTFDPAYEALLKNKMKYILLDSLQPIHKLLSKDTVTALLNENFDYAKPWFGQLMAGPQLLAYLIQINYWMIHNGIILEI